MNSQGTCGVALNVSERFANQFLSIPKAEVKAHVGVGFAADAAEDGVCPLKKNCPDFEDSFPQMDPFQKSQMGSGYRPTSPLKKKARACGVFRLRLNSEVGVAVRGEKSCVQ